MLLRLSTCYLSSLCLLSGLSGAALANSDVLKQQAPLEIPKSLNDLDLSPPVDSVKSAPVKPVKKAEKREVKSAEAPPAKAAPLPARNLSGLPEAGSYTTKAGDTLDKVLQKFYPNSPLRPDVLRDALVQNNPKAFAKGKPKQLVPGVTLSLPDAVELTKRLLPLNPPVSGEAVAVIPVGNAVPPASVVSTPAVPAGGGGAVAHSSGHNVYMQDAKRSWVRYP
jgi:Tfp pilus assembly protein FimV